MSDMASQIPEFGYDERVMICRKQIEKAVLSVHCKHEGRGVRSGGSRNGHCGHCRRLHFTAGPEAQFDPLRAAIGRLGRSSDER